MCHEESIHRSFEAVEERDGDTLSRVVGGHLLRDSEERSRERLWNVFNPLKARAPAAQVKTPFKLISRRKQATDEREAQLGATRGRFNGTSTRVFSDQLSQDKHSPYETLKRDDDLGPNEMSFWN